MKKNRILKWTAIVTLFGLLAFVFRSREMNQLLDLNSSNIKKIDIIDFGVFCMVTEDDDIEEVLQPLREMHARKKLVNNVEGEGVGITITYKNGKVVKLALLAEQININRRIYIVDKNHVNTYQKLLHKYKVK